MAELADAMHELRVAALRSVTQSHGFSCNEGDLEFALQTHPDLDAAFAALLAREGGIVKFSYGVRQAYKRLTGWYAEGRYRAD